jgi:hypothetical protein
MIPSLTSSLIFDYIKRQHEIFQLRYRDFTRFSGWPEGHAILVKKPSTALTATG